MTDIEDLLFVGTYGHVRAVDRRTGEDVWETSLESTGYRIVTLLVEDGVVYAGSRGHLYALDARDGGVLWHNELKGLGYQSMTLVTVKTPTVSAALLADEERRRHDAASGASAT